MAKPPEDQFSASHASGNGEDSEANASGEDELVVLDATAVEDVVTKKPPIPERLPVLPVRNSVAFPGTIVPLQVDRDRSKRVLDLALAGSRQLAVVAQRSPETEDPRLDDLYRVGTACAILKMFKMPDGTATVVVHGLQRIGIEAVVREEDYLEAIVHAYDEPLEVTMEQRALMHTVKSAADRIIHLSPNIPAEAREVLAGIDSPSRLADFLAANLSLGVVHKQELLETFDVTERLKKINVTVAAQLQVVELSHKIQEQVQSQVDKTQRDYYLREQLKAIQEELGGKGADDTLNELRKKIEDARMPPAAESEARREIERLERIPQASPEYSMALDYIEWLASLPWSKSTEDNLDIQRAEQILNEDHFGLEKIKKRILEFLAVRSLKRDSRGPILCFVGPPGVGKTSLGQSIARAMGRNFIRMSLGGVRDEATIRGHRRTYIGAMPGRIIREIRRAESNNPLFMLDEVDKIVQDTHGDPMSALLEVLDPAQNSTFYDHYLGVPFDLSKVLFLATGNYIQAIEPALLDRMEVIELPGYTPREKLMIAKRYLLPRQLAENGLQSHQLVLTDEALSAIISDYTREAGVRQLERKIASICRARATVVARGESPPPELLVDRLPSILGPRQYESEVAASAAIPGVATGLAFTPMGGEILFVEAKRMPGRGQLTLTGQLGDVMRESAQAAASIIRSLAPRWGIRAEILRESDVHIHVPAGAIPKDGPSAGVTMLAAMLSALTDRVIDPNIGMTGEITLSGRVLPVGGIREKVLAAHRAGLRHVILPKRNQAQLDEVPEDVRSVVTFGFVDTIEEFLSSVFAQNRGRRRVLKLKPAAQKSGGRKTKKPSATAKKTRRRSAKAVARRTLSAARAAHAGTNPRTSSVRAARSAK